jgi:hypothetical protein
VGYSNFVFVVVVVIVVIFIIIIITIIIIRLVIFYDVHYEQNTHYPFCYVPSCP